MNLLSKSLLQPLRRLFKSSLVFGALFLVFQNCGGFSASTDEYGQLSLGSTAPGGATADGLDYSGIWKLTGLNCYDKALATLKNSTTFSDLFENLEIDGNVMTQSIVQGNCAVTASMGVLFQSSWLQITNEIINSATGGNCIVTSALSKNTVMPAVSAMTYALGEKVLPYERGVFYFVQDTGRIKQLAILADYTDADRDYCFKVYQKN